MTRASKWKVAAGGGLALLAIAAAPQALPKALAAASPGLWEIEKPDDARAQRICIRDLASLAQIEQPGTRCTRVVLRDLPVSTEIRYTCASGGFGQSKIQLITPRSLRIDTQGIAADGPFHYVVQARRVGECPVH